MSYRVRLSPNARRDRDRIVAYYDDPERLQGDRFLDDFFATAHLLEGTPDIGRVISGDVRRWHLKVFRYQIWYRVTHDLKLVRIIAVVGDSQDEQSFQARLS